MIFEWDENKSNTCFENRGFDFAYAAQAFFDPNRVVREDTRFILWRRSLSVDWPDWAASICYRIYPTQQYHPNYLSKKS